MNLKIFLSSLLIFAFPITGATPVDGVDAGVQVSHEVAEAFGEDIPDTINAASQPSFLSPSYILESIENAYLPSALYMADAIQAFVKPESPPLDFWEMLEQSEKKSRDFVHYLLEEAAAWSKSTKFTDITSAMNHVVDATAAFRSDIQGALDAHNITLDAFTKELEDIFMVIANDLENIPLPDEAPSHAERAEMVDKVLNDTEQALIKLAARYGVEEEVVTRFLDAVKPHLKALIVAVGDINEQCPQLFPALAFSITVMLIPQSWILRPFLSVFGFGPYGPIKGSIAALLQSHFWGAAVASGSWFSWLQAAGMGSINGVGWLIKLPLSIGGFLVMLRSCIKH